MTKGEKAWLALLIMANQAHGLQLVYDKLQKYDNPYTWIWTSVVIVIMLVFVYLTGKQDS